MPTTFSRSLWYKDSGDSDRLKLLTGKTNVKLQPAASSYPTGAIALTETTPGSSGIYSNASVPDGNYKLYIDDAFRSEYGTFWIGDDELALYAKLAGGNTFTGNQIFDDQIVINDIIVADEAFIAADSDPYINNDPSFDTTLIWLGYLESRLAAINVSPYQESSNFRRCIPNGVNETNKVYTTLKAASASFASPSINNQCNVFIPGTGSVSRYISARPGTLIDYVNFTGAGRHINFVLSDGSSNTKITTFENLTLFFGANDYASARSYSNKTFINCTIYAYKDTTFSNCTLINCRVIHASTYKAYLTGGTIVENTGFNNEYDKTGITTGYVVNAYGIDVTTLPTDPSTAISPEE